MVPRELHFFISNLTGFGSFREMHSSACSNSYTPLGARELMTGTRRELLGRHEDAWMIHCQLDLALLVASERGLGSNDAVVVCDRTME